MGGAARLPPLAAAAACVLLQGGAGQDRVVQVNYGYFHEPGAHLWTYGVDAHSWRDAAAGVAFNYTFWPQTSGAKVIKKLQNGELDIAHLGSAPYASGALRGVPMKMLYVINLKELSQCLVAREGLNTPPDLRGMRVSYIGGSTTHFMLNGMLLATGLQPSDFEWIGHMEARDQMAAWDRGEIDAGFMWGGGMWHLQSQPWCSKPDPASPSYRPCKPEAANVLGHNLFTSGVSKLWGREVWTNLAVADHFAAQFPQTVFRSVKLVSLADSRFVTDSGFFTRSPRLMCGLVRAVERECTPEAQSAFAETLFYDLFLATEKQRSGQFIGQRVVGACDTFADPGCNKDTASGSAFSAFSASEFAYKLKSIGYLPPLSYFANLMDSRYIDAVNAAGDQFPGIAMDALAASEVPIVPASDPAFDFCGEKAQPILLGAPGAFRDHEGGGFHQDGKRCDWQIDAAGQAVLLSAISVRVERDADRVYVYEGLCGGGADCSELPLLAFFTGGKGMGPNTLRDANPRPPVLAKSGKVTVSFVPDATADKALNAVYDDGVEMTWSVAPDGACALPCRNGGACSAGQCLCVDGWSGADCSSPSCLGTVGLAAAADARAIVHGSGGGRTAHNADCRWEISAAGADEVVVLELKKLDVDWVFDPLELYEGLGVKAASRIGGYSGYYTPKLEAAVGAKCPGQECPGYIVSKGAGMTVRWSSDAMDSGEGFELLFSSAKPADVLCGPGNLANCNGGKGACSALGCVCQEGWFGQFCQLRQCSGATLLAAAESGVVRNMAEGLPGYAPNRDCSWRIRAPERGGQRAGSIALYVEAFDLEQDELSKDALVLAAPGEPESAATRLTGHAAVCTDRAACRPFVLQGDEVTVRFETDMNDYPAGKRFMGFRLAFEAQYDCVRGADGRCLALSECAAAGLVPGPTACERCPPHQYFDRQAKACRFCAAGQVPENSQQACAFCPPGRFVEDGFRTECSKCPRGRFAAQRGMTRCSECEVGTFATLEELWRCEPATLGHFVNETGASSERPCLPGTVAPEPGLAACKRCHAGTSQPAGGKSECVRCARGTFANNGAVGCTSCPLGPMAMTTEETGTSIVEQCGCPEGSFRVGRVNSSNCQKCPRGMICPFGSDGLVLYGECDRPLPGREECISPVTAPGYMSLKEEPLSVWQCASRERCPGGGPGSCAGLLQDRACQHCLEGYEWDGGRCLACKDWEQGVFLFPILPIILIPIIVVVLYKMFGDTVENWGSWQNGTASVAFILLNHFQVMTIARGLNIELPQRFSKTANDLSMSSDFTRLFRPECTVYARFTDSVPLKTAGPLIVLTAFSSVWGGSQVLARITRRPKLAMERNRTANAFLSIIFSFFGAIVELAFALFKCAPNPNGESTLLTDRSVVCGSDDWTNMLALGIVAVLLWCIGYGGLLLWVIVHAPGWEADRGVQMRWKFLFIKYRPDVHWWAMVIVVKGILLQQGQLFLESGVDQLFYLMTVLLAYVTLVSVYRPWRHLFVNFVDSFAHSCMIMACAAMLTFAVDRLDLEDKESLGPHLSTFSTAWVFLALPPAGATVALMYCFHATVRGKAMLKETHEMIRSAFNLLGNASEEEFRRCLAIMCEVDEFFCHAAAAAILAELGGRKVSFRVSSRPPSLNSGTPSVPASAAAAAEDAGPPADALPFTEELPPEEEEPVSPPQLQAGQLLVECPPNLNGEELAYGKHWEVEEEESLVEALAEKPQQPPCLASKGNGSSGNLMAIPDFSTVSSPEVSSSAFSKSLQRVSRL